MILTQRQQKAVQMAREVLSQRPVFLDTETTGLDSSAEIVEISIVDHDGSVLLESLVRPSQPIPRAVSRIHHITDNMVANAPTWPVLWPTIRLHLVNRISVIYNEEFDVRMMQQSHARYRLPWRERLNTFCLMKLYAQFKGEWNPARSSYRNFSLDSAGKECGLSLPNSHRSTDDTRLTHALLVYLASLEN